MSTFTAVLLAVWVLPIIGVSIAFARLSRRVSRELAAITGNRAVTNTVEARHLTRTPQPGLYDIPASADEMPGREELQTSTSGRVDIHALNERRLFTLSSN